MVTGVQEEMRCGTPGNSSGKEEKAGSIIESQFRSEHTLEIIEADQIFLALQ